jgi:hypothetical protein
MAYGVCGRSIYWANRHFAGKGAKYVSASPIITLFYKYALEKQVKKTLA